MARHVKGRCSFCGKSQEQVHRLIAGPGGVFICDECVRLCSEIINEPPMPPDHPPADRPPRWRRFIARGFTA